MDRIVIGGGSGLLGSALTALALSRGYAVSHLVRDDRTPVHTRVSTIPWDPDRGFLEPTALAGARAVVSFNGAGLLNRPWTDHYKRRLYFSRIRPVRTIVEALRGLEAQDRPEIFISASATGYYGPDSLDAILTEKSHKGSGFLANLCAKWEAEAHQAEELARVVVARTGLVMSAEGGMLGLVKHAYRFGVGVRIGAGDAWMPTIGIDDHSRAILFCIEHGDVAGPVNVTSPNPVRNRDWHRAMSRHAGRKNPLAIPSSIVSLVLGEAGREAILASARVQPRKLLDAGFEFSAPHISQICRQVM